MCLVWSAGMHVKIRLTVLKNGAPGNWGGSILEPGRRFMATPRYITPDPATTYKAGPQFGVSGVNDDLLVATRLALTDMISW